MGDPEPQSSVPHGILARHEQNSDFLTQTRSGYKDGSLIRKLGVTKLFAVGNFVYNKTIGAVCLRLEQIGDELIKFLPVGHSLQHRKQLHHRSLPFLSPLLLLTLITSAPKMPSSAPSRQKKRRRMCRKLSKTKQKEFQMRASPRAKEIDPNKTTTPDLTKSDPMPQP